MKTIYTKLLELLATVPAIRWVDLDKGQLEFYQSRPAVAFPCALIKVEITRTQNMGANIQQCDGRGVIRLAFDYTGETNAATLAATRNESLMYFDVLQDVYLAVQGKNGGNGFFNREAVTEENRADGLKVMVIPFTTSWIDKTAK